MDLYPRLRGEFLREHHRGSESERTPAHHRQWQDPPVLPEDPFHLGHRDFAVSNHRLNHRFLAFTPAQAGTPPSSGAKFTVHARFQHKAFHSRFLEAEILVVSISYG